MKRFLLEPQIASLGHADWDCSTHRDACCIDAEDETWARILATAAFLITGKMQRPKSPWISPELVTVREVFADYGQELLQAA